MTMTRSRQSAGQPTGGQFATETKSANTGVDLAAAPASEGDVQGALFRAGAGDETAARRIREKRARESERLVDLFDKQVDLINECSALRNIMVPNYAGTEREMQTFPRVPVSDDKDLVVDVIWSGDPITTTSLATSPGSIGVRTWLVDAKEGVRRDNDGVPEGAVPYDPATTPVNVPEPVQKLALWHGNDRHLGTPDQERAAAEWTTEGKRVENVAPEQGHRYGSEPLYDPVPTKVLSAAFKAMTRATR